MVELDRRPIVIRHANQHVKSDAHIIRSRVML